MVGDNIDILKALRVSFEWVYTTEIQMLLFEDAHRHQGNSNANNTLALIEDIQGHNGFQQARSHTSSVK